MSKAGFSESGLGRLHEAMAAHVDRQAMPGLAYLVARDGDVHVDVIGTLAFGDAEPMPRNAIFRIASLSKPVTAAAVMSLVDDGTLRLDDAVDDLLPELADRRVLRSLDSALDDTVPANGRSPSRTCSPAGSGSALSWRCPARIRFRWLKRSGA